MSARRRAGEPTPPAGGEPAPLAWLETLEARVHDAAARLAAGGAENARLRQRVAELEARLRAREAAGGAEATDADDAAERQAWRREREEVRERVARLAGTLAALLAEEPTEGER